MSSRSATSCCERAAERAEVALREGELHPHEELAALGVGRVLVGADDVRAGVGEEAGDGGDDAVAVGAGDEQAAVHASCGGYFRERAARVARRAGGGRRAGAARRRRAAAPSPSIGAQRDAVEPVARAAAGRA